MSSSSSPRSSRPRIVFVTREPIVHQQSGSTTYALGLLALLRAQGAEVLVVATIAYSRAPRLFFRRVASMPEGVALHCPGYLRIGAWYVAPWRLKAWARMLSRAAVRWAWMRDVSGFVDRAFGERLYAGAWDLTAPTSGECEAALSAVEAMGASTVIANYCVWGPVLADGRMRKRKTAILMHDLLSVRVQRFEQNGTALDMPRITLEEEMRLLCGANTVLAAQEKEADEIRPLVQGRVVVAPIVMPVRALSPELVAPGRCLFVGSNIQPNRTGLAFLLEAVWPRVREQIPGATLALAGSVGQALQDGSDASTLASLGVEVLGVIPDLEAEYARAAVCVVPLLLGTGIKIKLVEALTYGKAVVATSVGVEGLEAWASGAVHVAESAESFAEAMIHLLSDDAARRSCEARSLRLAQDRFGVSQELSPQFVEALL